jgi:tetratricopeptide (TPR) repeat protein
MAALSIVVCQVAFLGWANDAEANFAEAYELGQRAIRLDPRYPNGHYALGLACMWTQRIDRGIAAFEQAIRFNPSFAAAHVLLGQMCLYSGRREEALELVEKGIRLSSSDPAPRSQTAPQTRAAQP